MELDSPPTTAGGAAQSSLGNEATTAAVAPSQDIHGQDGIGVAKPPSVLHLRRLLVKHYLRAKDRLDAGMLPEGVSATVQNVQVNLVMLPRQNLRGEFKQQCFASHFDLWRAEHVFSRAAAGTVQPANLESLFADAPEHLLKDGDTVAVLAVASAGCGKTFVFTKVGPLRWALGSLWSETDVLSARELRCEDVRKAPGLSDLLGLKGIGIEKSSDREEICDYVRNYPERVCLVLDGLDETTLSDCSDFVQKVVRGEILQGIRLIVTSRPCADVFRLSELEQFHSRIELVGFRPDDVDAYIRKVLRPEKASALADIVKREDHLRGMMATPFIAKETCVLYHRTEYVPRCMADVFERLIVQVAERRSYRRFANWRVIPKRLQRLVLDLGKFAFNMLITQRLVFSEEDLQEFCISDDAIALGLLVACDEDFSQVTARQWRFSHLTMQESLAAKYQACYEPMTMARIIRLVESLGPLSGHLHTFWILLAAQLSAGGVECLVNSLLTREKTREWLGDVEDTDFSTADPFPVNFISPLCEAIDDSQMYRLAEELLCNAIGGSSGRELVEAKLRERHSPPSNATFLKVLFLTWIDVVPEANSEGLLCALKGVDSGLCQYCEGAILDHPHSSGSLPVTQYSSSKRTIVYQCFAEFVLHQRIASSPLPSLIIIMQRSGLCIVPLSDITVLRAVDTVLEHHSQYVCDVAISDFQPSEACQFPMALARCSEIAVMRICDCFASLDPIRAAVQCSSHKLVQLNISRVGDSGLAFLASALPSCSHLNTLAIADCYLTTDTAIAFATALSAVTTIQDFSLRIFEPYTIPEGAITHIVPALANCTLMQNIEFDNCDLSASALQAIVPTLPCWPHLRALSFYMNGVNSSTRQAYDSLSAVNAINTRHIRLFDQLLQYLSTGGHSYATVL